MIITTLIIIIVIMSQELIICACIILPGAVSFSKKLARKLTGFWVIPSHNPPSQNFQISLPVIHLSMSRQNPKFQPNIVCTFGFMSRQK